MALLVLLSAATRARLVPSHFRAGTNRLGLFRLSRSRLKLHFLLLATLPAFNFAGFVLGPRGLHEEQIADGLRIYAPHHVFE